MDRHAIHRFTEDGRIAVLEDVWSSSPVAYDTSLDAPYNPVLDAAELANPIAKAALFKPL